MDGPNNAGDYVGQRAAGARVQRGTQQTSSKETSRDPSSKSSETESEDEFSESSDWVDTGKWERDKKKKALKSTSSDSSDNEDDGSDSRTRRREDQKQRGHDKVKRYKPPADSSDDESSDRSSSKQAPKRRVAKKAAPKSIDVIMVEVGREVASTIENSPENELFCTMPIRAPESSDEHEELLEGLDEELLSFDREGLEVNNPVHFEGKISTRSWKSLESRNAQPCDLLLDFHSSWYVFASGSC